MVPGVTRPPNFSPGGRRGRETRGASGPPGRAPAAAACTSRRGLVQRAPARSARERPQTEQRASGGQPRPPALQTDVYCDGDFTCELDRAAVGARRPGRQRTGCFWRLLSADVTASLGGEAEQTPPAAHHDKGGLQPINRRPKRNSEPGDPEWGGCPFPPWTWTSTPAPAGS